MSNAAAVAHPPYPPPGSEVEPPPPPTCANTYVWKTPPRVLVHLSEFSALGGTNAERDQMLGAINDVVDSFNAIGGTSASITSVSTTTAKYDYATQWNKPGSTPTIHVGFVADPSYPGVFAAGTGIAYLGADCAITRGDVQLPVRTWGRGQDVSVPVAQRVLWDYGTPNDVPSEEYWEASWTNDSSGQPWFRGVFLHELLHAFNFAHSTSDLSIMNHRGLVGFPWANRPGAEAMRPLPADVAELRRLYPASDEQFEVAVLNNWFTVEQPDDPSQGTPYDDDLPPWIDTSVGDAGFQAPLCVPSVGERWAASTSPGTCGIGADAMSDAVCWGDSLKTRFTVANYSTKTMTFSAALYFEPFAWGENPMFTGSAPVATAATTFDVSAGKSSLRPQAWTVPALPLVGTSSLIVRVIGVEKSSNPRPQSVVSDWIPLRGRSVAADMCISTGDPTFPG